jgi:hypothetical protein
MDEIFTGVSGTAFSFQKHPIGKNQRPRFAVAGLFMFASVAPRIVVPVFVVESLNVGREFATFALVGTAISAHRCNYILWHQGPAGVQERKDALEDIHWGLSSPDE